MWMQGETLSLCTSDQSCLHWVSVDPDGDLYPCEYLRHQHPYGNIREMDLADILATPAYRDFQRLFSEPPPECAACDFLRFCGNGCPATRIRNGRLVPDGVYVYCQQRRTLYTEIKRHFDAALESNP